MENKKIRVSQLQLSLENPRFKPSSNQSDAIEKMIQDQGEKLLRLARHIVYNGLNPLERIAVIPCDDRDGKYNVIEGNRRITAIKLLKRNSLIPNKNAALKKKFKQLSKKFKENPIDDVPCVVFQEDSEPNMWTSLKHTGANDGVGTVTWDAQQKARFDAKRRGKQTPALQVLDLLKQDEGFDANLKERLPEIPSSSLDRLLSDPTIRKAIGLEKENGKIFSILSVDQLRKPLRKIISDLLAQDFTVGKIYAKKDREEYLKDFDNKDLPDFTQGTTKWEIASDPPPLKSSKTVKTAAVQQEDRKEIVPSSCRISISNPRVSKIFTELKSLSLRSYINAAAISFRVFIELSVDDFLQRKNIPLHEDAKLKGKLQNALKYMKEGDHLPKADRKPIEVAISSPSSILSISTFHEYVHNKGFSPIEGDLKRAWDNFEAFLVKLWEL